MKDDMHPGIPLEFEPLDWFDLSGDEDAASDADQIFLDILRERARSTGWRCDPDDTTAFFFWNLDHDELKLVVTLSDPEKGQLLFSYGLVYDGQRIVGDIVHDQTHDFELGTIAHVEEMGSPEALAARAADWFETILGWPVERREWVQYDQVIYREWEVRRRWANLAEDRTLAHTAGRSRPVAPPDRVVAVR